MSEPARHHYTPQFYLSAWCSEGKGGEGERLCVVQNFNGQIRFTRRAPKAIGFQDHLYSFSDSLPTPEPAALETKLFSPLDNKGKVLITKLIAGERLDPEERRLWATFLAAMRARTPENIALVKELGTRHVKWELTKGQGEYDALKTEGDPETIVELVESRYPGLIDNFGLSTFPRVLAGEVILKIAKMTWHLQILVMGVIVCFRQTGRASSHLESTIRIALLRYRCHHDMPLSPFTMTRRRKLP